MLANILPFNHPLLLANTTSLNCKLNCLSIIGFIYWYFDVFLNLNHNFFFFFELLYNLSCGWECTGPEGMLMLFFLCFSSVTVVLFCMAALIFPMGFYIEEVGGQPYKLPNNTVVGSSYVLFVLSIFFTIVGLLFAGKVCLPGWHTLLLLLFLYI